MLTNNYYEFKKLMFSGGYAVNGTHPQNLSFTTAFGLKVEEMEGGHVPRAALSSRGDLGYWLAKAKCAKFPKYTMAYNDDSGGVYFGTGSTPASLADYCLESPIESGLTITNPSQYTFNDNGEGQWTYSAEYMVTNTSGAEINIYEIGIVTQISSPSKSGTDEHHPVLMERTVLASPITIPAGGVKLINVTVTQNNMLNVE
jgi:hypothetical protein